MGPGVNNSCECFMVTNNENLATKNSKIRFDSLDECLTMSYTTRTYLKGHQNPNKRQRTEPTKLVPISFIELKIKREKDLDFVPIQIQIMVAKSVKEIMSLLNLALKMLRITKVCLYIYISIS